MNFTQIKELDQRYVLQTYSRNPVAIDHGRGATLWDTEGKEYIDFTSGIGVCSLGYGNADWARAIYDQAMKLGHISNLFYTEPYARLASKLVPAAGMAAVFFGNSGAEANEGMIKTARKYSFDKYGPGRSTIITLNNSFHGRTITTLKATGQDHFHEFFFPFTEGFRYADANDMASLQAAAGDDVCAVMMELIQGEGGVNPLDADYVQAVAKLCADKDWLLLIDEVQTGVGRTGTLFAYQQFGVQPDVVSFAKGIAGGLPFGGFLTNEKCRDRPGPRGPRQHLRRQPHGRRRRLRGAGYHDAGVFGAGEGQGPVPPGRHRRPEQPLRLRRPGHGPDDRRGGPGRDPQGAEGQAHGGGAADPHRWKGYPAAAAAPGHHQRKRWTRAWPSWPRS